MKTTIILAIIVTSMACAIESRSPRTTRQIPNPKVEQRPCKGKKCSIKTTAPHGGGRIIGGKEAIPHSWPWMAFIRCTFDHEQICGGNLISDRWIITAGHCLILANQTKAYILRECLVLLGKHDITILEPTQLIPIIADFTIHEKYDAAKPKNGYDLALIKLAFPVKFTDAIQPIGLPFGLPELPFNKTCIATGWGDTKYGTDKPSAKLMQLPMFVMREISCRETGRSSDRVICTTSWVENKNLCHGDSGGPLACQEADGKWYLRGVTSMSDPKCTIESYFTKVAFFEEWIKNIIRRK